MENETYPPFSPAYKTIIQETIHTLLTLVYKNPSSSLIKDTIHACYDSIAHQQERTPFIEETKIQQATVYLSDVYYDEKEDQGIIKEYYKNLPFNQSPPEKLRSHLCELLKNTHNPQLSYSNSRKVLHSSVDIREDGELQSIYSGQNLNTHELKQEDDLTEARAVQQLTQVLDKNPRIYAEHKEILIEAVLRSLAFNVEHVIPQSWFNKRHPMVGDLHHLFTCEKDCNSFRSNIPFYDFEDYSPGAYKQVIKTYCGKRDGNLCFEPENGKGEIARAVLYFLLRYPNEIIAEKQPLLDIHLYNKWHKEYPVTLHEKHRNWTIYKLQGNRNPYIDFPEFDC